LIWSWFGSGQVQVRLGNWVWGVGGVDFLLMGVDGWIPRCVSKPEILDLVARICRDTRDSLVELFCVCL